jgi:ribonuclease P protein component
VKIERIRKTKEFADVFKNGTKIQGEVVSLYARQSADTEPPAAGIAVPKKYATSAVKRNYVKRVINAYFRQSAISLRKGVKLVVKVSKKINSTSRNELARTLKEDLEKLLGKAGIAG